MTKCESSNPNNNNMEMELWTAEMEIDLFYSMIDHKPVGENKNFHMIFINEKYNNLNEKKMSAAQIWDHLATLYDLNSLNENDIKPFPGDQVDFRLPSADFETFIIEKTNSTKNTEDKDTKEGVVKQNNDKKTKNTTTPAGNRNSIDGKFEKKDKYEFCEAEPALNEDTTSSNVSSSSINVDKTGNLNTGTAVTNENSLNSEDTDAGSNSVKSSNLTRQPSRAETRRISKGGGGDGRARTSSVSNKKRKN